MVRIGCIEGCVSIVLHMVGYMTTHRGYINILHMDTLSTPNSRVRTEWWWSIVDTANTEDVACAARILGVCTKESVPS